jgi:hypothetical protein
MQIHVPVDMGPVALMDKGESLPQFPGAEDADNHDDGAGQYQNAMQYTRRAHYLSPLNIQGLR